MPLRLSLPPSEVSTDPQLTALHSNRLGASSRLLKNSFTRPDVPSVACLLEYCGFKCDPWLLPTLRYRILIQGPSYVLDVDAAALYPNFPGDDFAFSIQKERHRQKNNAAVALFKRGYVANDNRVVDVHFSCVVRDVLCAGVVVQRYADDL